MSTMLSVFGPTTALAFVFVSFAAIVGVWQTFLPKKPPLDKWAYPWRNRNFARQNLISWVRGALGA